MPLESFDVFTMPQAARACGLSTERFRKVWRTWVATLGFPAPFNDRGPGRGGGTHTWRAAAIEAWKERRELALGHALPQPTGDWRTGSAHAAAASHPRIAAQRAQLRAMMSEDA